MADREVLRELEALRRQSGWQFARLYRRLGVIETLEELEMADLSRLQASVDADTTVDQSAITLLTQLSDMLRAAATDPAEIAAIADQLDANSTALAAAVTANTPAAPGA
jgi:hypothetical protein